MSMTFRVAVTSLALVGISGFVYNDSQQAGIKIAFVNGEQLLDQAPGRAAAEAALQKDQTNYQAHLKRLGDSVQARRSKYLEEQAGLSPAARTAREKEIGDMVDRAQRTSDSLENVLTKRQSELLQPILDLVNKVLSDVRTEEGYTAIWNIASRTGGLVAYDKNLDITDRVLLRVKAQPAPKPPTAGAPATGAAGVTRRDTLR
jgi:outer membrane protein